MTDAPPAHTGQGTPAAEIEIDEALVRSLLEDQHADLAHLSLRHIESGWDNATWKLGTDMAVRVPRRAIAHDLLSNEQKWLPELAKRLPLPVPAPLRNGKPTVDYPWNWSVLPWLNGGPADLNPPNGDQAEVLAGFLRALHIAASDDAPTSEVRGVPLSTRVESVAERMARLKKDTDAITPRILALWDEALAAPMDMEPTWLHGDLHARNVLVQDGKLTGVIDWGDMCSGDPACDMNSFWMLLPDKASREAARTFYGNISDATWARARGWAILMGVVLLDTGLVDTPRHAVMGAETLRRVGEG